MKEDERLASRAVCRACAIGIDIAFGNAAAVGVGIARSVDLSLHFVRCVDHDGRLRGIGSGGDREKESTGGELGERGLHGSSQELNVVVIKPGRVYGCHM